MAKFRPRLGHLSLVAVLTLILATGCSPQAKDPIASDPPPVSSAASPTPTPRDPASCQVEPQTSTDYSVRGFLKLEKEALPCVAITIENGSFSATTRTDENGMWRLYVPSRTSYTLTVDTSTLPEGIELGADQQDQSIDFGLTTSVTVIITVQEEDAG